MCDDVPEMKAALFAMTLAACVSPTFDATPTITATSVAPSPVPANADGSYSLTVTFSYNDNSDVMSYTFVAGTATLSANLAHPGHIGTTKFNVTLGAGTPSGSLDYTVTITDAMQRMSDDGQGTIELSPP